MSIVYQTESNIYVIWFTSKSVVVVVAVLVVVVVLCVVEVVVVEVVVDVVVVEVVIFTVGCTGILTEGLIGLLTIVLTVVLTGTTGGVEWAKLYSGFFWIVWTRLDFAGLYVPSARRSHSVHGDQDDQVYMYGWLELFMFFL